MVLGQLQRQLYVLVDIPFISNTGATEQWNGTSWTEVNDLNTAREQMGSGGIQMHQQFGGGPKTGKTEFGMELVGLK